MPLSWHALPQPSVMNGGDEAVSIATYVENNIPLDGIRTREGLPDVYERSPAGLLQYRSPRGERAGGFSVLLRGLDEVLPRDDVHLSILFA